MATTTYTIPLRKAFQKAAPLKRTPKAVRAIKTYVQKHAKVDVVKLGAKLNTALWARGITRPPHKVVVHVLIDDGTAKVELEGFTYEEAKKAVKKQEPQSLKEKIQEKIGAPKREQASSEATKETPAQPVQQVPEKSEPKKNARPPKKDASAPTTGVSTPEA